MADYTQPDHATRRVRFFDGQFLQEQDFIDEQKYHLDRERRLARTLSIAGVVAGLNVTAEPSTTNKVRVTAGTAVDRTGRFLVLPEDRVLDLPAAIFNDKTGVRLVAVYREQETELATTGSKSERRWLEEPQIVAITADGQGTDKLWDDTLPTVLLAGLNLDNRGAVTVDLGPQQVAGAKVPGRVGIGFTQGDPTAPLEVRGGIRFGGGQVGGAELSSGATYFGLADNTRVARLSILQSNGNVGIGTTTPGDFKLHVNGRSRLGGMDDHRTAAVLSVAPGTVQFDAPNVPGGRLHVDGGSGNVGVGTNAPGDFKLHVNGRTRLGGGADHGANTVVSVAPGTVRFDAPNVAGGRLHVDGTNGRVGIGQPNPRSALDTGVGVMTGAANDYEKAQFTMSGGGTVSWGGRGQRLKWTARFIAISMERGPTFASGYVDIAPPTGAIPAANVWDGAPRPADANGVVLNDWESLYAVHTVGGNNVAVGYQIRRYTDAFTAPSNWLLVAVVNGDDNTVKLGTGVILAARSSSTKGSPIPVGTITMWSGAATAIPDGWALCNGDGGTPDLRSRFVVGAGEGGNPVYGSGQNGDPDQHSHSISVPGVTLATTSVGHHDHAFPEPWYHRNFADGVRTAIDTGGHNIDNQRTGAGGGHNHNVTLSVGAFNSAGSGGHNRPKWWALCFIMKL